MRSVQNNLTTHVQQCLERLRRGDESARELLLESTCERLRQLASMMLRNYSRVHRYEETADVLNNALIRLNRALTSQTPESPRHYFRLAALQIRRELKDLAKRYFGPLGMGHHAAPTDFPPDHSGSYERNIEPADQTHDPGKLEEWAELHEQVENLPDDEREVFELIWYHQISQVEIAELLDVSRRTVIRRWQAACFKLHEKLFS